MKQIYKIGILGLGYVGLPLAKLFASKYSVIGFDINKTRISELRSSQNKTLNTNDILNKDNSIRKKILFTSNINDLRDCNIFIITVPTPVDKNNNPDLSPLLEASEFVGYLIKKNNIVIYESTVYPGATEEECVPIIEKVSGLAFNSDFYVGYSPERINPGDEEYTVEQIKKVTSGSTPDIAKIVDNLYSSVIKAGTYMAPSIKVAEASKIIENTQRDINIAFVNETKKILDILGIETSEVLAAASTKWNFLNFTPGLVGGHCIGVDPFYLIQRAHRAGYAPELIMSARKVNESMGIYVAHQVLNRIKSKNILVNKTKVLVLGFTFKANCSDIRNTKVEDIVSVLKEHNLEVTVYDPLADPIQVKAEYNIELSQRIIHHEYNAIILAVNHKQFESLDLPLYLNEFGFIYSLQQNYHIQQKNKLTLKNE